MPGKRGKLASTTDSEYETHSQLAVDDLAEGTHKTVSAVVKAHDASCQTLSDHVNRASKFSMMLKKMQSMNG
ncbi:hypothetical protein PAXRUDRAFT_8134 [Paxillus rubicundulus Ve08.2h10]|uniref:Uncharacterized protein n=1 Tax=Paxillus rubicundulus Ve08.2h10 TaxID=930991 RepID=A0A0D0DNP5_9AGAM|nr:hypothetical protein PAXRUDRAFT_8134 [Paxillus rubicundulus Ve08.2h10]